MILSVCPNPSVDKFLILDDLKKGAVNKSFNEKAYPGGKGVHVAMALNELGTDCRLVGFWGGVTGKWIQNECKKAGVPCSGPTSKEWNRTCITLKMGSSERDTEILERGPFVSPQNVTDFFSEIENQITNKASVSVSGSWPEGSPDDGYIRLKRIADSAKAPLWTDASGERLRQAVQVKPFGIHINIEEAENLFGTGKSPLLHTQMLLENCTFAAVTDGANGLFLGHGGQIVHAKCDVEKVISTVGCGDCLLAGLIHSYHMNKSLNEMAGIATACGAANCVHPDLGIITRQHVQFYKKKVIVKQIS